MFTLAEVAARTDDRILLKDTLIAALDAHSSGSPAVRREAAGVLAQAAWQRDDVEEAARWLSGDAPLLLTPLWPVVLDHVILTARVAAAADHAGLRASLLDALSVLERERPRVTLFTAVAQHARGILSGSSNELLAAADSLKSSSRPLLYASAAEDAGRVLASTGHTPEAVDQLNAAFNVYTDCGSVADARRVGRMLRGLGVERRMVTHQRAKTGWNSLTESEMKVVHLAAQGAINRNIAQQLHLSPHTVKSHLRQAYSKLGVNSRLELRQLVRGVERRSP
jgi:DNA-binding CsgD family transcriptional regulator